MKQFLFDWILAPKIAINLQIILAKIKNRLKYDQSLFKKNEALKDVEKGSRCFVIAPGPSLNQQDLTLLKDETCIAISTVYAHKDFAAINPKYYVLSPVFKYHGNASNEESLVSWLEAMDQGLNDDTIMFMHISDKPYLEKYSVFKNKKIHWIQYIPWDEEQIDEIDLQNLADIKSVSETSFSVALYLGFDEIYIMGFDHNWFEGLNIYFDQKAYSKHFKVSSKDHAVNIGHDSECAMGRHSKMFKKYKALFAMKENIYNANSNENTYVDTFPKVKFEALFSNGKEKC